MFAYIAASLTGMSTVGGVLYLIQQTIQVKTKGLRSTIIGDITDLQIGMRDTKAEIDEMSHDLKEVESKL